MFFQILIAWLLADFLTGLIHWFEDRYMDSYSLNFLNSISEENDLHHKRPTAMLLSTGWTNMKSSAAAGWPLALVFYLFGCPLWLWLVPFFASFGNLVHRWAHTPKSQLPRLVRGMQEFGLFISHQQHDEHHRSMKKLIPKQEAGFRFCGMTDWLNPILDSVGFWGGLEWVFSMVGLETTETVKNK